MFARLLLRFSLLSQTELCNNGTIALNVYLLQVAKKISSVADHLLQTAAAVKILLVCLQVLGKIVDAGCENGNLHLRGTRIAFMDSVLLNQGLLFFLHHGFSSPFFDIFDAIDPVRRRVKTCKSKAIPLDCVIVIQTILYHNNAGL